MQKKLIFLLLLIGFFVCDKALCVDELNQSGQGNNLSVAANQNEPHDLFITPEVSASDPDQDIMVKSDPILVNNQPITEAMIDDGIKQQLANRNIDGISAEDLQMYKSALRPRVIDNLINIELIRQVADKEGLSLTEQDIDSRIEDIVDLAMEQTGMTREELAKDILKRQGITIEESLAKYRTNQQFLDTILLEKVASVKQPLAATVTDEEIKDYYEANRSRYSKKEMVRASHILVLTLDENGQKLDENGIEKAREKVNELKKKVDEPGSDFAELAREFSDCPSGKSSGGDLGFFPRSGAMVEPFAAAAFELKPGQMSDIVETQYGFHIIKCTDRNPAVVTALDDVKEDIRKQLSRYKKTTVLSDLTAELRKEAEIKYLNPDDDPANKAKIVQQQQAAVSDDVENATDDQQGE